MNITQFGSSPGHQRPLIPVSPPDVNVLLCKHVKVSVRGGQSLMTRSCHLLITIEEKLNILSHLGKELAIKITDETDPFMFYSTTIGENDFLTLKQTQGLLSDFHQFPTQITSLLNLCSDEEHKATPRYLLRLNVSDTCSPGKTYAVLEFIETNPFKHLTHLSLRLGSLDETSFRKYLLSNFQSLRNENEKLTRSLQLLQNDMRALTLENQGKSCQLDNLRQEFSHELSEREKTLEQQMKSFQRENSNLKDQIEKDKEVIAQLKNELEEKSHMLQSVEEEVVKLTDTISSEDDIKKRILNLQGSLEQLQQSLQEKNEELEKKTNEIEELTNDLQKGHEIIRKLQNETLRAHSKLDLLNEVSTKQEHIVSEKDEKLKEMEADLKLCMQRMKKKECESEKFRKEVDKLREELDESEEQIKTKENLICWLNKQLASLKPSPSSPPERMTCVSTGVPTTTTGHTNGISSRLNERNVRTHAAVGLTVSGRPIITSSSNNNNPSNQRGEQSKFSRITGTRGGDWIASSGGRKMNPLALSPSIAPPSSAASQHFLPQVNLNDKHVRSSGLNHLVYPKN